MSWFPHAPTAPGWRLDWPAIVAALSRATVMAGWEQAPVHRAEDAVPTVTRMVCETLVANPSWRALPVDERDAVFAAALLHTVARLLPPVAAPDGRAPAPRRPSQSAIMARGLLWRMGISAALRERICGMIHWQQAPCDWLSQGDPLHALIRVSQTTRCDHVALLCAADVEGRGSGDRGHRLERIAQFQERAAEEACLTQPWPFTSAHARVLWFRDPARDPRHAACKDTHGEVVMMSGLPGAGKDTWIAAHRPDHPVISLDAIRAELSIHPSENQHRVIQLARARAREHLQTGAPLVWNATTLTRRIREPLLELLADYSVTIRAVCLEAPPDVLFAQNAARAASVPRTVIERMAAHWQPPDTSEVHALQRVGGRKRSP